MFSFQAVFSFSLALPSFIGNRWQWVFPGGFVAISVANFAVSNQQPFGSWVSRIISIRGKVCILLALFNCSYMYHQWGLLVAVSFGANCFVRVSTLQLQIKSKQCSVYPCMKFKTLECLSTSTCLLSLTCLSVRDRSQNSGTA